MCHSSVHGFGKATLVPPHVRARHVLEVGSRDVNGSLRSAVLKLGPVEYLGVDIESGPGVDQICDGCEIVERFGEARWGLIVCTETLEHALDWRGVVSNLKRALAVDGHLLLTTRSAGFPYHGHPFDYWRFEKSDMMHIFGDMTVLRIESDPEAPGVFVYMRKQSSFRERALAAYNVASVAAKARSR